MTSLSRSSPGAIENSKFKCDETFQFWKDFQRYGFASAQENAIELAAITARFAQKGPECIDFLARHVARSGYHECIAGDCGVDYS
jgi:hypothetical protein